MKNFALGLIIGLLGIIVWLIASVIGGFGEGVSGEKEPVLYGLMSVGFLLIFLGPLTFWVIVPVVKRIRRKK